MIVEIIDVALKLIKNLVSSIANYSAPKKVDGGCNINCLFSGVCISEKQIRKNLSKNSQSHF